MAQPPNYCLNHGEPKGSHCSGHRAPQGMDGTINSTFLSSFAQGAVISSVYINSLRSKIAAEVARRKMHNSYNSANTATLMTRLNMTINRGEEISAANHPNAQNSIMNVVGGPGSPGRTPRGGTQLVVGSQHSPPYTSLADINSGGWNTTSNVAVSNEIFSSLYLNLINNYQRLHADCICHSDCNCNAVCACHNDCGCNYSDKRLKKEIIYW